ncbi:MAG TPA: SIMPL domain-containing protein [Phycisphaerales bacterium]|nr:SIMPL domain-containing protein [Phycisphaerales bacterium]
MEYRVRLNLLSTAVVLAIGIAASVITSTIVAARAYQSRVRQLASNQREITVKGSARERVTSDIGVWSISVSERSKALADGYTALESSTAKVQAFLAEQGFSASEIALASIETDPHHARDERGNSSWEVEAYTLSRVLTVTSPQVARFPKAEAEVTRLMKDGVSVRSYAPRYYYSRIADLKIQILGKAAQDAHARAQEIAKSSGGRVADVRSVQMGVLQITEPHSTEVSSAGLYDTSTIEKDVTAVVTVAYGLES